MLTVLSILFLLLCNFLIIIFLGLEEPFKFKIPKKVQRLIEYCKIKIEWFIKEFKY